MMIVILVWLTSLTLFVALLERNILRVAIEELAAGEVPKEVVLDEAVTLAKTV